MPHGEGRGGTADSALFRVPALCHRVHEGGASVPFTEILIILMITAFCTKAAAFFAAEAGHLTMPERRAIAIESVTIQAVVLGIFVARGPNILELFHVSIFALEVAGGLILLLFAIGLVLGEDHSTDIDAPKKDKSMAVYPLAVPLLASPQAIVAVTIFSTRMGVGNRGTLWAALAIVIVANFAVMLGIAQFGGKKPGGKSGLNIAPIALRIVALLLAALAVEIMAIGLRGYGIIPPLPGGGH
jgi:multiple antibiotic resistance protein